MKNKQFLTNLTVTCAGVLLATAAVADAQQDSAAFNAGVKAAQQDSQFLQGVQANNDEETLNQLLSAGNGVANPKYDETGALKSAHIVVHVGLTKSLPAQFAKNAARKIAATNSKAEFVKWLKTNCRTEERSGEMVAISVSGQDDGTTGQGGGSAQAKQEFGTLTENTAQGLAVGIITIKEAVIGDEYVGIFGWSKKLVGGAQSAEQAQNKSGAAQANGAQSGAQGAAGQGGAARPTGVFQGVAPVKPSAKGINDF
jgi:hypothetical protein